MFWMHSGHVNIAFVEMHCKLNEESYAMVYVGHFVMCDVYITVLEYAENVQHDIIYTCYKCSNGS